MSIALVCARGARTSSRPPAVAFAALLVATVVALASSSPAALGAQRTHPRTKAKAAATGKAKSSAKTKTKAKAKASASRTAHVQARAETVRPRVAAVVPTAVRPDSALRAFQVDTVAEPIRETLAPRYPRELRSREVQGSVIAEFVVDTVGRVEPGTFRVISSDDPAFTTSVRDLLPRARFLPAINEGRLVRQTVRQTFVFDLDVLQRPRTRGAAAAPAP